MKKKSLLLLGVSVPLLAVAAISVTNTAAIGKFVSAEDCPHTHVEFYDAVAPTTTTKGQKAHYACCDCHEAWLDEAKTISLGTNIYQRRYAIDFAKKTEATPIDKALMTNDIVTNLYQGTDKLKGWDQTNWEAAPNGKGTGTVEYAQVDDRYAMYLSANLNETQRAAIQSSNSGYSECRFALPSRKQVKSVTFDYKYYDLNSETREGVTGVQSHSVAQYYSSSTNKYYTEHMNLVNDNEWHSVTVYNEHAADVATLDYMTVKIYHMEGEIYLSNMRINYVEEDVNLKASYFGNADYGNYLGQKPGCLQQSTSHVAEGGKEYQLCADLNMIDAAYSSYAVYFKKALKVTEVGQVLKVHMYLSHDTEATGKFRMMKENATKANTKGNPGNVFDTYYKDYTIDTNKWVTIDIDANAYARNGEIIGIDFFYTTAEMAGYKMYIDDIRLVTSSGTDFYYDLTDSAFYAKGYNGDHSATLRNVTSYTKVDGSAIDLSSIVPGKIVNIKVNDSVVAPVMVVTKVMEDLAWIKANLQGTTDQASGAVTGYYVLGNDIEANGYSYKDNEKIYTWSWTGYANGGFKGTFDGRGHTINNFVLQGNGTGGLISYMGWDGVMKNVNFSHIQVNTSHTWQYSALCFYAYHATFENITMQYDNYMAYGPDNQPTNQGARYSNIVGMRAESACEFKNILVDAEGLKVGSVLPGWYHSGIVMSNYKYVCGSYDAIGWSGNAPTSSAATEVTTAPTGVTIVGEKVVKE